MVFFLINPKKKIMTILVMQHLKMEEEKVDLQDLAVLTFLIYLKIFLVTLEVGVDEALEEETVITEVQI